MNQLIFRQKNPVSVPVTEISYKYTTLQAHLSVDANIQQKFPMFKNQL